MPQTFDISSPQPSSPKSSGSGPTSRGTGTAIDDIARGIFYLALVAFLVTFGYLLWGIYGGAWADPNYTNTAHAHNAAHDPQSWTGLQLANITLVGNAMLIAAIVGVLGLIICSFRDEGLGYVFGIAGALVYFGLPYLTNFIYEQQSLSPSEATRNALSVIQGTWWVFVVPAAIFMIVDIIRRMQAASEAAAIQRANVKYGSGVGKQHSTTQKQKFLGRCWELPYCRDHVRTKCPIYNRRRGPCWWYKEGCMCEERIVLQAVIANDWKQQAEAAGQKMHLTAAAPKALLSATDKRERCRKCVIYNEHQRQKYKLLVGITFVTVPALLYLGWATLQVTVTGMLTTVAQLLHRFTLGSDADTANLLKNGGLQMVVIVCLGIVIVAQVLKIVEFLCFKLKV